MLNIITCISSIVAAIGTIGCIIVSIVLYKKQQKKEHQELLDELNSMKEDSQFPMSEMERFKNARMNYLQKRIRKI